MTDLLTIARLEFVVAARLKWIRLLTAAFALLAAAAAYSAGAANELSPKNSCTGTSTESCGNCGPDSTWGPTPASEKKKITGNDV